MPERQTPPGRYRRRRRRRNNGPLIIAVLAVILIVLIGVAIWVSSLDSQPGETTGSTQSASGTSSSTQSTAPSSSTEPTKPPVTKVSTATISNTGDFLMHMPVTNSGYNSATGTYSYDNIFTYFSDYVQRADYAVANLETTLYGPDWVYYEDGVKKTGYHGYPGFNSPDALVEDLQEAGFDMLLTANNHSYDTRSTGFHRTQKVIGQYGLDHLGSVTDAEETLWKVKEVNGIRIGMVCYTYQTGDLENVSLNGIPVSSADSGLIGTFSESYLSVFYEEMESNIAAMEAAGAEAIVLYIHWGVEYQLKQNSAQSQIAQKMCDLGVDVIVGGHAHVVQPMELLTSTEDPEQKTVCLYSMGNAVSNQRLSAGVMKTAHTEDGVLFSFTFAKYSDGTVILESADILPLWVNMYYSSTTGKRVYEILPLDKQVTDWKTQFQLTDSVFTQAEASYERTMKIVGSGLEEIQQYLQTQVAETESRLGIV